MAHHGDVARPPSAALSPGLLVGLGGGAPARVHRAPVMTPAPAPLPLALSAPAPAAASSSAGAGASAEVTLESPRPDGERTANEYVETPFRPGAGTRDGAGKGAGGAGPGVAPKAPGTAVRSSAPHHTQLVLPVGPLHASAQTHHHSSHHHHHHHLPHHNNNKADARTPPPAVRFATGKRCPPALPAPAPGAVVTKQPAAAAAPAAATFKKDSAPAGSSGALGAARPGSSAAFPGASDCSIICSECGRCRCQSCRRPRPLPQCWLCNNMCLVSAESVVDYASCLCCVKGLYYHCVVDNEADASLADDPCSCGPPRKLSRWGCLGLLSLVLPCLWCYWPARGCVRVAEKAYARYASQGCRCEPRPHAFSDASTPQKRLLDAALDF
ncbi:hypothetical protein R5R35_012782 [Gryllus longicercus]|uniref:Sprouty n=1 Tax=Gryllus longicercus TaxID=2509291 RepID=A0AAN9VNU4_9ORTH